jgi:DegV family protein with EDD domain
MRAAAMTIDQSKLPDQQRSKATAERAKSSTAAPLWEQAPTREKTVALITDSVAQVPVETARELGIAIVPLTVQIEGKPYRDGVDLDLTQLYNRMRNEKVVPTTIAPSPGEFEEAMRQCLDHGAKSVLCISLSSRLSSSYQNACLAARLLKEEEPGREIEVLDSLSAAACEGFMAITAAQAAARGEPMEAILQAARQAGSRTGLVASFETLEYLARGGRIGKAAYMMGSLINIKPIITLDQKGTVAPAGAARSTKRALQAMVDFVGKRAKGHKKLQLTILEAEAPEQAAQLLELAEAQLQPEGIHKSVFTPVMGVHTGPGLIGLVYYYE